MSDVASLFSSNSDNPLAISWIWAGVSLQFYTELFFQLTDIP